MLGNRAPLPHRAGSRGERVLARDGGRRADSNPPPPARQLAAFQAIERAETTARLEAETSEGRVPHDVADLLDSETAVIRRAKLFANEIPVMLDVSYRLPDAGAPAYVTEAVSVRRPRDDEELFLGHDGQLVLAIRGIARADSRRIMEVSDIAMPLSQWQLAYEWTMP